jgi:hypothetical protein
MLDDKSSRSDNADNGKGDSVEGTNSTTSVIDSLTHNKREEPGPSNRLQSKPAAEIKLTGSLFWVSYIFVLC